MLVHNIDPVAFHIGPLKVYWYGLSYFLSVMIVWQVGVRGAGLSVAWLDVPCAFLKLQYSAH